MSKKKTIMDMLVESKVESDILDKLIDEIELTVIESYELGVSSVLHKIEQSVNPKSGIITAAKIKDIYKYINHVLNNVDSEIVENSESFLRAIDSELSDIDSLISDLSENIDRDDVDDFIDDLSDTAEKLWQKSDLSESETELESFLDTLSRMTIDKEFPKD